MVNREINIDINARDNSKGVLSNLDKTLNSLTKQISTLNQKLGNNSSVMNRVRNSTKRVTDSTSQLNKELSITEKLWNNSANEVYRFNGNLLGTLFFGMEMQRIFGGALSSLFEGYKKIIPEGHKFNTLTRNLTANWEYFKFQLADALFNSEAFQNLIVGATNLVKAFADLSPQTQRVIGWTLVLGTAFGALLFYVSVIGMGIASWANIIKGLGVGALIVNFQKLRDIISNVLNFIKSFSLKDLLSKIKGIPKKFLAVIMGEQKIVDIVKNLFNVLKVSWGKSVLKVITGIKSLFKASPLGWLLVLIEGIFESFREVTQNSVKTVTGKILNAVATLAINVVESIAQTIAWFLDAIYNSIVWAIERLARMWDIDIDIPRLDLANWIDGLGDSLQASIADAISSAEDWALINYDKMFGNGLDYTPIDLSGVGGKDYTVNNVVIVDGSYDEVLNATDRSMAEFYSQGGYSQN